MKIKLIDDTFELQYTDAATNEIASFIFRNDQRIFLNLIDAINSPRIEQSEIINEGLLKTLTLIDGIGTENGEAVKPSQFFLLPKEIVVDIRSKFLKKIMGMAPKVDKIKNDEGSS